MEGHKIGHRDACSMHGTCQYICDVTRGGLFILSFNSILH